jgi:hypothetical protein
MDNTMIYNIGVVAKCNLCEMELPVDDCWDSRKAQHETFHSHRTINNILNVNTVVGIVKWLYNNESSINI